MKIALLAPRPPPPHAYRHPRSHDVEWKQSAPFFLSPRGCLVHRIRRVTTHFWDGQPSHTTVEFWCGNVGRGEILHEPPKGRLLCSTCEANAVVHDQPNAETLVGRHVCIGKLRAVCLCCQTDEN